MNMVAGYWRVNFKMMLSTKFKIQQWVQQGIKYLFFMASVVVINIK